MTGDPIVFEMLRFLDGLVWTVNLTVEIKLRFQISPAELGVAGVSKEQGYMSAV